MSGIGHRAHGFFRVQHHLLDCLEHDLRTSRAVGSDHIYGPFVEPLGEGFGIGAAAQIAVIVDGDLPDDHHIRPRHLARREDGLAQLVEIVKRLEDQQIHFRFHQRLYLFAENRLRLGDRSGS